MLLGLALCLAELLTPGGFYLIFFGAGALALGGILFFVDLGQWLQLSLFAALSLASLSLFRKRLLIRRGFMPGPVDAIVGETAYALEDIAVEGFGKAELRGTSWSARNVGDSAIGKAQRCRVEKVDGLTIWIKG